MPPQPPITSPLCAVLQARAFNAKWKDPSAASIEPRLAEFLGAGAIYASPLTRATETALLACEGHPYFKEGNPLLLCRQVTTDQQPGSLP